ncbi:MAG: ester cyclase, partial [Cyclobacteriaceae bacterium]|nr:ester cyclase [Cyclobacteriaceae bacterium]
QEKIDIEKEKEAIKAVLEKSSQAYLSRDFDSMASTWIHDESAARLNAGKFGYGYSEGWDKQDARYKTFFENNPEPSTNKEALSNYRIKVYQESAWAIFDKELRSEKDELINEAIHTAFLEKESGEWKITYLSTLQSTSYDIVENNIKTSETYHKLNPEDIDDILTDDFIGRHDEYSGFTWNKENHQNYWTNNTGAATDTIYHQIADGNWVATRFQRKMNWQGKDVEVEAMHFKRFENGKIAEIWEYADTKQLE